MEKCDNCRAESETLYNQGGEMLCFLCKKPDPQCSVCGTKNNLAGQLLGHYVCRTHMDEYECNRGKHRDAVEKEVVRQLQPILLRIEKRLRLLSEKAGIEESENGEFQGF